MARDSSFVSVSTVDQILLTQSLSDWESGPITTNHSYPGACGFQQQLHLHQIPTATPLDMDHWRRQQLRECRNNLVPKSVLDFMTSLRILLKFFDHPRGPCNKFQR